MSIRNSIGLIAAVCLTIGSIIYNYKFGYIRGGDDMGHAYAFGGVVADMFKAVVLLYVIDCWRKEQKFLASLGICYFVFASLWSLASAVGLEAQTRTNKSGTLKAEKSKLERLETRQASLKSQISALGKVRPAGTIQAEIDSILINPKAEGCKAINGPFTRKWCPVAKALQAELAIAHKAERLSNRLIAVHTELDNVNHEKAAKDANPQSNALAYYFSLFITAPSIEQVDAGLSLLFALMVEFGSGIGLTMALSDMSLKSWFRKSKRSAIRRPSPKGNGKKKETACVVRFRTKHLKSKPGESLQAAPTYQRYKEDALNKGLRPMSQKQFGEEVKKLGVKKTMQNGRVHYRDLALAA